MMLNKTSIKTRMGWISVFEENGKIFQIKFGKIKKKTNSNALKKFKRNLIKFFDKKTSNIKSKYYVKGNATQSKVWTELKKNKDRPYKNMRRDSKKI